MLRIHRNMFSDHLTLANIGISIFDLQISTLGRTIGCQNHPFCPGVSQLTFGSWILASGSWNLDSGSWIFDSGLWIVNSQLWIMNYELWIMIDDYDWWLWMMIMLDDWWLWYPNIRRCVFRQSLRRVDFSKKTPLFFLKLFTEHENCKNWFFLWKVVPLILVCQEIHNKYSINKLINQ